MVDYVPCKPVHKGCFPHPGVTDNQHVRFAAAAQHLHDHAVLPVTVDGRVKPVCRGSGKVHAILGEKGSGRGNGALNETLRHAAGNSRRFVAYIYGMDIFLQDRERPELVTGKGDTGFVSASNTQMGLMSNSPICIRASSAARKTASIFSDGLISANRVISDIVRYGHPPIPPDTPNPYLYLL